MKKLITIAGTILLIVACFISASTHCQIYFGFNGTNVPENLNTEIITGINEMVPEGETFTLCFRNDKYAEDGIDIAPDAEINNLIRLRDTLANHNKEFALIYTFDTRGRCSVTDAFYAFDILTEHGIQIIAARMGNEEFAKVAGHWPAGGKAPSFSHYKTYFEPIIAALNTRGYAGDILFTIAEEKYATWNTDISIYAASDARYTADIHIYWNEADVPAMSVLVLNEKGEKTLPTLLVSSTGYSQLHDDFYGNSYVQVTGSSVIDTRLNDFNAKFPGKKAYITEFGPMGNVGNLGNTLGYEATVDWFLNQIKGRDDIAAALKFNGPGSITGCQTKKSTKDKADLNGEYVKRLDYWTFQLWWYNLSSTPIAQVSAAGDYIFSFHNLTRNAAATSGIIPVTSNLYVESLSYEFISGANFYSSSGVCAWWMTGSDRTYEITGSQSSGVIPPLSFGYIHATVKLIPIPGCTDRVALNYNPEANSDDGTCYYFSDCSCVDPAATNYNPEAPCANNSLCTYPAPEPCYKERILFKFLGCRADPKCEFDNCKK